MGGIRAGLTATKGLSLPSGINGVRGVGSSGGEVNTIGLVCLVPVVHRTG